MSQPTDRAGAGPRARTVQLGPHQFLEISGEALKHAAYEAVLAAHGGVACGDAGGGAVHVTLDCVRGLRVLTPGDDQSWLAAGAHAACQEIATPAGLRAAAGATDSPLRPDRRTPMDIILRVATDGAPKRYEIEVLTTSDGMLRGHLFQQTRATLTPDAWREFVHEHVIPKVAELPRPFRLSLAIGGTSAEASIAAAARADSGAWDALAPGGDESGSPLRPVELERELHAALSDSLAQTPGEVVCSQVRIIRMVRHGGSLPVALYCGLPSDRRARVTLDEDGAHIERHHFTPI